MRRSVVGLVFWFVAVLPGVGQGADWLQFRSQASNSAVASARLPSAWNHSDRSGIAWQVDLPGRGPASPIVVGGRVIVTASSGVHQDRLLVLAFDAGTGRKLWERQFWATGRSLSHPTSANAAPTPASDGQRIFAFFSSNDLVCLDLEGNLLWLRGLTYDFAASGNDVGMAASPLVVGDVVVVQSEAQGEAFAEGIDRASGQPRWHIERPRESNWTSPVALRGAAADKDLVLLQSPKKLTAHEASTGRQVWSYDVPCDAISSPVVAGDTVFVPAAGMTALRPGAPEPTVLWSNSSIQPGAASAIVAGDRLYAVNRAGVLLVADARSGEVLAKKRLEGAYWSTPVLVGNRLYAFPDEGPARVVEIGDQGRKVEVVGGGPLVPAKEKGKELPPELSERIQASPAVVGDALYLRSDKHLWKIAAP